MTRPYARNALAAKPLPDVWKLIVTGVEGVSDLHNRTYGHDVSACSRSPGKAPRGIYYAGANCQH